MQKLKVHYLNCDKKRFELSYSINKFNLYWALKHLTWTFKCFFKATFKPFGRLFSHLKKTLSRKSINTEVLGDSDDNVFKTNDNDDPEDNTDPVRNVILRRMQSNKRIYEKLRTKSHIYSDRTDAQATMSSLFDYCLVVGLRDRGKSVSTEQLNYDGFLNRLNPSIIWRFPERIVNLNESITEFCFPDPSCQYDAKKSGGEIFQFTLTNFDGSRTYGNCIKLVSFYKE